MDKVDVYAAYQWECPKCGELNHPVELPESGDIETCYKCQTQYEVESTPGEL